MSFFILLVLSLVWADMMEDEKTQSLTPHRAPRMDHRMNQKPTSTEEAAIAGVVGKWDAGPTLETPKCFLHDTSYPDAYILCKMRLELASSVAEE
jgi:hypothetical protein